jgi:AbiV family abortive infection protein
VDLGAVKAASRDEIALCAAGAAGNARDLLEDAELLSAAGRHARAYALAALAVEEAGKAGSLFVLAVMPPTRRARVPLGRMLEWHQLKLVGGMLIAAVPSQTGRTFAAQFTDMPEAQVERIVENARALAQDQDRLKQLGLYADIDSAGRVRLPSEVTADDVPAQLDRARQAVSSASLLLDPGILDFAADPPREAIEFNRAIATAFGEAGHRRTPDAAAAVLLSAISKFRAQAAASGAGATSPRPGK